MTPAVEAPDLSGLIELSRNPRLDLKPVLLRVQTDLFLAAPIRDRAVLEGFAVLAGGLIPTVDRDTALIVAGKLAPCADTPDDVLAGLIARGGMIAETVLMSAPALSPDLIERARALGLDVDARLARRAPVAPEPPQSAPSNEPEADILVVDPVLAARRDPEAARALLADPERAPADLAPLWLHASPEQRAGIRAAIEATAGLRSCPPAPRGLGGTLTAASKRRDVTTLVASLADALGLPHDFLGAATDATTRYDLLTLGLRAADLSEPEAFFIFLSLNDAVARSVPRMFELVQLFRTTSRAAARELLAAILDTVLAERAGSGEHRSYLAPDAPPVRRNASVERALPRAIAVRRAGQNG